MLVIVWAQRGKGWSGGFVARLRQKGRDAAVAVVR